MTKKTYNASDIDTLEILDAIQLRSGMYIGSVDDDGVEVCVREVVDNAVDEHMNGNGNRIVVSVDPETGLIGVEDAARGIPVENHPKHPGLSTLEVVLTKAHSGGKFGSSYGVAGGLHGTGLKAVTALSSHLKATVWRDAKEHTLVFNDAKVVQKLDTKKAAKGHETRTGTMIEFRLDPARFPDATSTVPARERLQRMLRERAYLNPGLKLYLRWKGEKEELFHEKSGIDAYVSELAGDGKIFPKVAHFDNAADSEIRVSVALAWTKGYGRDNVLGFCNCVRQPDGGTHVTGLRLAMPGIVRSYIESNGLLTAKDKDLKIDELGRELNLALAGRVKELARYRSEFFGRLQAVLGERKDVQIVGDRFVFSSEVLFPSASDEVSADGMVQLTRLAETLKTLSADMPQDLPWVLQVDGHTDRRPIATARFPSNWELSTARALAIVKFLRSQGIPPERLAATGYGEFHPLDARSSEEAYARNRRIELKLTSR